MAVTKGNHAIRTLIRNFRRDEEGSIIVFSLLIFLAMLLATGMAVDFLRFRYEMARVQEIGDRAVLAAAKLENDVPAADVVRSYFAANNATANLAGEPFVEDLGNFRRVQVDTEVEIGTFFLWLAGINSLTGTSQTEAQQGLGDIEISLVLDISYSMRLDGKIDAMRDAAVAFAQSALDPQYDGKVSLNVVPYAGGVNLGPDMFELLDSRSYLDGLDPTDPDDYDRLVYDAGDSNGRDDDILWTNTHAYCLNYEDADYNNTTLPHGRDQTAHFLTTKAASPVGWGWWCPLSADGSEVVYARQEAGELSDPDSLVSYLANLDMSFGTSTHHAAKVGLALLDPDTQTEFAALNNRGLIPNDFADRPKEFDQPGVQKVMVLMTDGEVFHTQLPDDPLRVANTTDPLFPVRSEWTRIDNKSANFGSLQDLCTLAKEPARDIKIFTVAFAVNDQAAIDSMRGCASNPVDAHYYAADQSNLTQVFEEIAGQISELRLTF